MGLNINALKKMQDDLNTRGSGDLFFYANKIGAETDVRLLPPLPQLNGVYCLEQIVWWINNKPYVSPATFDQVCPIDAIVTQAKRDAKNDKTLQSLLDDERNFSRKSRFIMPILLLDCKFDNSGQLLSFTVVDGKPKILVAGAMLTKAINKVVTSRNYQNGTEDGIMDRVKGFNMILGKTGKNLDTDYTAEGWTTPLEMDAQYYGETIPDILKMTEDDIKPNDYLEGVINNYLYGDPMPPEPPKKKDDQQAADATSSAGSGSRRGGAQQATAAAAPAPAARATRATRPAAATDTGVAAAGGARAARRGGQAAEGQNDQQADTGGGARRASGRRSLADDLNNLD